VGGVKNGSALFFLFQTVIDFFRTDLLKADPQMAQSAYNLSIITAKDRIDEAVAWCRKAAELRPQDPKYAYTLAFYLNQKGDRNEAIRTLRALIEKYPGYNAKMPRCFSRNYRKRTKGHRIIKYCFPFDPFLALFLLTYPAAWLEGHTIVV
jgi:tetratricopeptide (TPR) repeat protein